MNTKLTPVASYQEDACCPNCNSVMSPKGGWTSEFVATNKVRHECSNPNCSYEELLDDKYPRIVYRPTAFDPAGNWRYWRATDFSNYKPQD
jgi:hypothetical protein